MPKRDVVIVDPSVAALLGHPLPQAAALVSAFARQGYRCTVVTHCALPANAMLPESRIVRHFSLSPYEANPGFGTNDRMRSVPPVLTAELAALLRNVGTVPCHFVFPTVNTVMAIALGDLFRKHGSTATHAAHVFSLTLANECGIRVDDSEGLIECNPAEANCWRDALQAFAAARQVHLFAVSEEMAQIYAALTSAPLGVVRPFHSSRLSAAASAGENSCRPRIALFAGQARNKKNFAAVPEIARLLLQRQPDTELFVQVHHCTTPEAAYAARQLRDLASCFPNLKLVEGFLPDAELARIFLSCDIAFLGYRAQDYAGKTSGFLWDAIASGQIVVTPGNTWLARECRHYGAPCLAYAEGKPEAAAEALETAVQRIAELGPRAMTAAQDFLARAGPDALVRDLAPLTDLARAGAMRRGGIESSPTWQAAAAPMRPRLKRFARKIKHRLVMAGFPGGHRSS